MVTRPDAMIEQPGRELKTGPDISNISQEVKRAEKDKPRFPD
jgi:hypothetical protein